VELYSALHLHGVETDKFIFFTLSFCIYFWNIGHGFVTAAFIRLLAATDSGAADLKQPDNTIGQVPVSQKTCRRIMFH
jgi:hypothetical protein